MPHAPVTAQRVLNRFEAIRQWEADGKRAPHKPLLALLALGRVQRGEPRLVTFKRVEPDLRQLLHEFGPPWPTTPLYPFWYLQTDLLWEVPEGPELDHREGKTEPKITSLRAKARGGFPEPVDTALRDEPGLLIRAAQLLLNRHFEPSLHAEIATACGLDLMPFPLTRPRRNRHFRDLVLRAYEYRCAVCGWNVFVGRDPLGLEAAHLFWHRLGGPDDLTNGLALCSIHHLALDRGAISIDDVGRLLVSQHVNGSEGVHQALHELAGQQIRDPQPGNPCLAPEHAAWHRSQVFRSPARAFVTGNA